MKTIIPTPDGFIERFDIRSGAIERAGFVNCGVIFTTYHDPSPEKFDATQFLDAVLENIRLPETEDRRFFTIAGGYYMQRTGIGDDAICTTTHVFGVAANSSQGFDVVEGGDVILADSWKLIISENEDFDGDPSRVMSERLYGEEGWTLIVREAYPVRNLYPMSGQKIALQIVCPEITNIEVSDGELTDTIANKGFRFAIDGPAPTSCTWDFGDGSDAKKTEQPSTAYDYARTEGEKTYAVSVTTRGPGVCTASTTTTITVPALPKVPECPKITGIDVQGGDLGDHSANKTVRIQVDSNDLVPTSYMFDWDDGTAVTESDQPSANHDYRRLEEDATYTIKVTANGPGDCAASTSTTVTIPALEPKPKPECAKITTLESVSIQSVGTQQQVQFSATVVNAQGNESYIWDFGDSSPSKAMNATNADHTFDWLDVKTTYTVKVKLKGNDECADSEVNVDVTIPAKPKNKKCKEGSIACWIPLILLVALIVLYFMEELDDMAIAVLGLLDIVWIIASWRCLCRQYLPFLKEQDDDGCKGARLACWLPIIIAILAIIMYLIPHMTLLAAFIVVGLAILWIILSWRCLCRPYLPFLK